MPTRRNKVNRNTRKNRKNRKGSRVANRKGSRVANRSGRKCWSRKNSRRQAGGSMAQSLAQGQQFASYHKAQHGGAYLSGAPVSEITGSGLPADMRSFARVEGLDASFADASTQRDPDQVAQVGGRRKKSKSKKSRKTKKSRKSKKSRQSGGFVGAPYNQPTMLLNSSDAAKAGTADFSNPLLKH